MTWFKNKKIKKKKRREMTIGGEKLIMLITICHVKI